MSRMICFAILSGGLLAASGCSSCFGGGAAGCRRPSFMEFRSPCRSEAVAPMPAMQPCAPACAPVCEPACAPAAPCCEGGAGGAPVVTVPGTFS